MFRLSDGEEIMTLAFFVLIQYRSVTGGQTDRQTDRHTDIPPLAIPAVCIARYANALVKTFLRRGTAPSADPSHVGRGTPPPTPHLTPHHTPPGGVLSSVRRPTSRKEISRQWEAPRTTYADFTGDRSLAIAGPRTWNNLPDAIRDSSLSFLTFAKMLKSYLFV